MKKLLKEVLAEMDSNSNNVHIHMKDGSIYANMKIQQLSDTALKARSQKGPIHLIQYDEIKQVKMEDS